MNNTITKNSSIYKDMGQQLPILKQIGLTLNLSRLKILSLNTKKDMQNQHSKKSWCSHLRPITT